MLGRLRRKSWVVYVEKVICQYVELGRLQTVDLLKSVMSRNESSKASQSSIQRPTEIFFKRTSPGLNRRFKRTSAALH